LLLVWELDDPGLAELPAWEEAECAGGPFLFPGAPAIPGLPAAWPLFVAVLGMTLVPAAGPEVVPVLLLLLSVFAATAGPIATRPAKRPPRAYA
jgi:hypothetical protein